MVEIKNNFWMGVGIGTIIIIIIDLIIPFLGPLLGGFVAGFIAKKDILNAGKAGFIAGVVATIVISLIILTRMISHPMTEYASAIATGYVLFILITFYLALFALFGGLIAGAIRK